MRYKRLYSSGGLEMLAVVLDEGDEVVASLCEVAAREGLNASSLTAVGAFSDVVLGFYVEERKDYDRIPIDEQVEVVSLVGDVTIADDGGPKLHAHVVVAKRDSQAHGGHLLEAHVSPTLEVILTETPEHLRRRHDEQTGLALIDL